MSQKQSVEEILNTLEQALNQGRLGVQHVDDFKKLYTTLDELWNRAIHLLDGASRVSDDELKQQIKKIQEERTKEIVSVLAEKLRSEGYNYGKKQKGSETFAKSIENLLFRLIEQTRLSRRAEVFFMLLRAFTAYGLRFPYNLSKAFKPIYNNEDFKVLLLSFLAGLQQSLLEAKDKSET